MDKQKKLLNVPFIIFSFDFGHDVTTVPKDKLEEWYYNVKDTWQISPVFVVSGTQTSFDAYFLHLGRLDKILGSNFTTFGLPAIVMSKIYESRPPKQEKD